MPSKQKAKTSTLTTEVRAVIGDMRELGGSKSFAYNMEITKRTLASAWPLDVDRTNLEAMTSLASVVRTALAALAPADPVEGMIAAQAVGLHHAAMELMRRAVMPDQSEQGAIRSWKLAANLSRAMTEMIDARDRRRAASKQRTGDPVASEISNEATNKTASSASTATNMAPRSEIRIDPAVPSAKAGRGPGEAANPDGAETQFGPPSDVETDPLALPSNEKLRDLGGYRTAPGPNFGRYGHGPVPDTFEMIPGECFEDAGDRLAAWVLAKSGQPFYEDPITGRGYLPGVTVTGQGKVRPNGTLGPLPAEE